jgi:DNA polymerase
VKNVKTISIDIETYSDVDLGKCGVYRYSESPDFEILLFGYSVDGGPVQVIDLASGESIPEEMLDTLTDDTVVKWAFNANFERVCLSRYLRDLGRSLDPFHDNHPLTLEPARFLNPEGWRCSMVWAATMGLPLSLKGVGAVLGLEDQKMDEGKALIRYFSVSCAPTKANGGRTRNLPSDDPGKWETFKKYNQRDVEVEMSIQRKLRNFPVPDFVWDEYHIDQEINDRGVRIDMDLVEKAIDMDTRSRGELTEKMQRLTNLDNPNSVQQMKQWLSDNGMEVDSLGKKAVTALLKTAPPELAEVLELRQQLAKSSVKKYQTMQRAVCDDSRARGMFMFYGANRTGRWAGRLIQLQNLPQNHLPDLDAARALVKSGDYDAVKLLYEDVPDTLSQLIRTAFIPRDGCRFYVADFSAIEARVIAWYAGEQWKSDAFANGEDIYCSTASTHVPQAGRQARHQRRAPRQGQDRGTGVRLRRLDRSFEGDGRTGDGTVGGGASGHRLLVAGRKPADREVLVGRRQGRHGSREEPQDHPARKARVLLAGGHAVHHPAVRSKPCVCEAEGRHEPFRRRVHHLRGRGRHEEMGAPRIVRPEVRGEHRAGHQPRHSLQFDEDAPLLRYLHAYP